MKLYLIGGLGADERVFQFLDLQIDCISLAWIEPLKNESIHLYSKRLSNQIDSTEDFGLLGVSFGGLIANEISKILKPKFIILISSLRSSKDLPKLYALIGRIGIINYVPSFLIKPPQFVFNYLFDARNKALLNQIISDTDPKFVKWALSKIANWKFEKSNIHTIQIHGKIDKLFPIRNDAIIVRNGGHFMIVDKAQVISNIINRELVSLN